jgi:16S rRNA (uracil1498-N3)-methyltransferase
VVHARETKLDKLQRHVIEASKQCGRNVLMQVRPTVEWATFCRDAELPPRRVLGHPAGDWTRADAVNEGRCDTVVAVGPEGGFTTEEVAFTQATGWRLLDLGARVLRVETAAIALAVLFG